MYSVRSMWLLISVGVCFQVSNAGLVPADDKLFSINDIVDGAFGTVRRIMKREGYEPMILPDYQASFLQLGLIEIAVGQLSLTQCRFFNLSTIYRSADVNYERQGTIYSVQTTVAFDNLKLNCSYEASLLGLIKKRGVAVVNLPNLSANTSLDIAVTKLSTHLKDLQLIENDFIDVHLEGGILDNLGSVLTETVSNLFKNVILSFVQAELKKEISGILDGNKELMNNNI